MTTRPLLVAALCAAAVGAEIVAGKATRDALFLTSLSTSGLPAMLIAAAFFSILLVAVHARTAIRINPAILVPSTFAVSGVLFLVEWLVRPAAPSATAIAVYLHVSAAGPLLASGFWLVASERFDPRTAKERFGQIGSIGILGGLLGALVAERVAVHFGAPAMLVVLSGLHFLAAWMVRAMIDPATAASLQMSGPVDDARAPMVERARAIAHAPHLRHLMALVVLGTTGAALVDYLFRVQAVDTFGSGDQLLRFFALFYGATSLVSFLIQAFGSSPILRRSGLALPVSSPSIAVLAGSIGGLIAPGFGSLLVARAGESILRASWFRSGYELFFTPIHAGEKRLAKPFIDVALDRLGDAIGGGIIRLVVVFVPLAQSPVLLTLATVFSLGAILAASHLNRWYLRTLERSLVHQGGGIDLALKTEGLTVAVLTRLTGLAKTQLLAPAVRAELEDVLTLRTGTPEAIVKLLSRPEGVGAALIPHVIPLLARDAVADRAMFALRKVAEERVGELTDALIDRNQEDVVRRRLARVFSVCVSQRAADGLMLALDDERFDVRFQAARSLAAVLDKNPQLRIDANRIERVVLREVAEGQPRLAHVFTLLSLILPREPVQIAFRSLNSPDRRLRGTALEYLDEVLPASIRRGLWTLIAPEALPPSPSRERVARIRALES